MPSLCKTMIPARITTQKVAMSANCQHPHNHHKDGHGHSHDHGPASADPRYRRILWVALVVNAAMFALEIGAGLQSGSASLLADAIDFLGDAANYALSLWVLSMALAWRARAALVKGVSMLAFGMAVVGRVAWGIWQGVPPEPLTMGASACWHSPPTWAWRCCCTPTAMATPTCAACGYAPATTCWATWR